MAMNKKEKAYVEDLEKTLESLKAQLEYGIPFRETCKVGKDVPPPTSSEPCGTLTKGYYMNAYNLQVTKGCSSFIGHNTTNPLKTRSQGSRYMYSTEKLAYQALRYELQEKYKKTLNEIDIKISKM